MTPLQLVIATWVALALVLTGLGSVVQRCWRRPVRGAEGWLRCFWLGWAALLLLLQLWHFALPIDDRALAAAALTGIVGLAAAGLRPWTTFFRGLIRHLPALVLLALATAWTANRALGGPGNGDTGYYFIPTVVWLRAYAIVPGLANLSPPFGYNQTYFHYIAMLETGPLLRASNHVANGVLVLALIARSLLGASRSLRRGPARPVDLFYFAMLPAALGLVFGPNLTSPAPDFAVFALGIVLAGELIALLEKNRDPVDGLCALAVLCAAAVTVKLSLAGLAATTLLVASVAALRQGAGLKTLTGAAVLSLLWILPWLAGNLVMSGYPVYPSSFGGLPLPWRVPENVATLIRDSSSLNGSLSMAWREPKWFLTSLDSLGWNTREVLLPLGMTGAALVLGPLLWLVRRLAGGGKAPGDAARPGLPALALLPTVVALVFWFLMAPRPRFAGAAFWLLGIQAVLLALGRGLPSAGGRGAVALLTVALGALAFHDGRPLLRDLRRFEGAPLPTVHEQTLPTGLVITVPENLSCWDSPPPCTPDPNPGLELLRHGDLGGGFRIDPAIPQPVKAGPGQAAAAP